MERGGLIERIYEAAFVSEMWPDVLRSLADVSGSAIGSLLVFSTRAPPFARSTAEFDQEAVRAMSSPGWMISAADRDAAYAGHRGFYVTSDLLTDAMCARDAIGAFMKQRDFGEQASARIELPTSESAVFTFDRRLADGRHAPGQIDILNSFMPDLSRATLVAARLGVAKAQSTVAALQLIGLPAAVMTRFGVVLATNRGFDALADLFVAVAGGGLAILDSAANRLLKSAVEHAGLGAGVVSSIPIRREEQTPLVVHVAPLKRGARDIFSGADVLLAVTEVRPGTSTPSAAILAALFDLTQSEVRVATLIAQGRTIAEIAVDIGVTLKTARTYLDRIFAKTGVHRQSDLAAMLRTTQPPTL